MKNTMHRAETLAKEQNTRFTTGHVLLALVLKKGSAAKLLSELGLNESRVRGLLRESPVEPANAQERLVLGAEELCRRVYAASLSEMHLLGAAFKMKNSVISDIFLKAGIDITAAYAEAVHRSARMAGRHTGRVAAVENAVNADYQQALPLPDALSGFNTRRAETVTRSSYSAPPPSEALSADARRRARRMMSIGSEIEHKQRMRRTVGDTRTQVPSATQTEAEDTVAAVPVRPKAVSSVFTFDKQRFPLLAALGRNLVQEAVDGAFEDIVGRSEEMERIAEILHKRRGNCPCLVGPSGVGKTALVEGFAALIARGEDPDLGDLCVLEIRPSDLVAGTAVRGALAERIAKLKEEVAAADGKIVLFFDEFAALLSSSDAAEAVQELKAALGKGALTCIAAATDTEYARYIESDPALVRRFSKVDVTEPSEEEAVLILKRAASAFAEHHGVTFEEEAVEAAVRLSARYIQGRALPDKALALIDTAGARARRRGAGVVERDDIAHVAAEVIGIAKERLASNDRERLLHLESVLAENIIGHRHVLSAIAETLRRNAAGFRSGRPIGSFLFLGPTGVGKTETAKTLGDFLFPDKGAFIRLDMSEFGEAHAVARLIGAPPGYVGHEEGGQLTEAVRRRPYCLVLLDEIEKAHPDVLKVLLQILDDGRLTDGLGRTVPFENTIIVMTSNLGCNLRKYKRRVGFGTAREMEEVDGISQDVMGAVHEALPPELWNRMDEILVFEPLQKQDVLAIAKLMLARVGRQLKKENDVALTLDDGVPEYLAAEGGFDPEFGARPMRRTVQRLVEGPIAKLVLEGRAQRGRAVRGFVRENRLEFEIQLLQ